MRTKVRNCPPSSSYLYCDISVRVGAKGCASVPCSALAAQLQSPWYKVMVGMVRMERMQKGMLSVVLSVTCLAALPPCRRRRVWWPGPFLRAIAATPSFPPPIRHFLRDSCPSCNAATPASSVSSPRSVSPIILHSFSSACGFSHTTYWHVQLVLASRRPSISLWRSRTSTSRLCKRSSTRDSSRDSSEEARLNGRDWWTHVGA